MLNAKVPVSFGFETARLSVIAVAEDGHAPGEKAVSISGIIAHMNADNADTSSGFETARLSVIAVAEDGHAPGEKTVCISGKRAQIRDKTAEFLPFSIQ